MSNLKYCMSGIFVEKLIQRKLRTFRKEPLDLFIRTTTLQTSGRGEREWRAPFLCLASVIAFFVVARVVLAVGGWNR